MKISINDIGKRGWLQGPEFIKELEEFDKANEEQDEEEEGQ